MMIARLDPPRAFPVNGTVPCRGAPSVVVISDGRHILTKE
jgi:hypothetical protein